MTIISTTLPQPEIRVNHSRPQVHLETAISTRNSSVDSMHITETVSSAFHWHTSNSISSTHSWIPEQTLESWPGTPDMHSMYTGNWASNKFLHHLYHHYCLFIYHPVTCKVKHAATSTLQSAANARTSKIR
jgi:hypothetical protein